LFGADEGIDLLEAYRTQRAGVEVPQIDLGVWLSAEVEPRSVRDAEAVPARCPEAASADQAIAVLLGVHRRRLEPHVDVRLGAVLPVAIVDGAQAFP
jgi:hypothetical protein